MQISKDTKKHDPLERVKDSHSQSDFSADQFASCASAATSAGRWSSSNTISCTAWRQERGWSLDSNSTNPSSLAWMFSNTLTICHNAVFQQNLRDLRQGHGKGKHSTSATPIIRPDTSQHLKKRRALLQCFKFPPSYGIGMALVWHWYGIGIRTSDDGDIITTACAQINSGAKSLAPRSMTSSWAACQVLKHFEACLVHVFHIN